MIISLLVHTAVWLPRAKGALTWLVGIHVSLTGLYLPPLEVMPPQTIISFPVQTDV
jgi:hypothetical protein